MEWWEELLILLNLGPVDLGPSPGDLGHIISLFLLAAQLVGS